VSVCPLRKVSGSDLTPRHRRLHLGPSSITSQNKLSLATLWVPKYHKYNRYSRGRAKQAPPCLYKYIYSYSPALFFHRGGAGVPSCCRCEWQAGTEALLFSSHASHLQSCVHSKSPVNTFSHHQMASFISSHHQYYLRTL
jgi:hypothetical protein